MALKKFGNTFGNKLLNQSVIDEDSPKRAKKLVDDSSQMPERPSKEQIEEYARSLKDKTGLEPMPVFRDSNGKINPKYKASRGQGALAGGAAAPMNGNPFHDLFSSIGGIAGGAVSPVLASKQKYVEDVKNIQLQNQTTEAHMRLQAQAQQVRIAAEREQRMQQTADFNQSLKEAGAKVKTTGDKSKFLIEAAKNAPSAEQRTQLNSQFMKLWELEGEPSEDFGQEFNVEKIGDFAFLFDKNTRELINAKGEDGASISALNTQQQVAALAAWTKLGEKDTPTLEESLEKADEMISQQFKGGLKPAQYNSLKMQLAKQIIGAKDSGATSGKVIIDGKVIPIPNLPILGQKKPMEQTQPAQNGDVNQTSPFMQDASQQGDGKVVDGTTGQPMATPAKQEKPPEGYDLTLDDSRTKKSYWAREIAPVNFPKGKTRVTKGGKEYIFENGKYYELVPR